MGRIVYLMMSVVAINLALLLFSCSSWDPAGQCIPQSTLWTYLLEPQAMNNSSFWDILFGTTSGIAAIAATVIIVGSFFMKLEFPLYASIGLALIYPMYSWIKLFQQLQQSGLFSSPEAATVVAIIIASPILITYIFTLLDWMRGRD